MSSRSDSQGSDVKLPEEIDGIVDENRELLEAVADGHDESARMAQNILDAAEENDG